MQMRKEYIDKQSEVSALAARLQRHFESPDNYLEAKAYVDEFYDILINPSRFKNNILMHAVVE